MNKVIVIGGGIVGASCAYHLARAGVDTVLVDRRDAGRATSAGAGIVAPGTSLRDIPPFYTLAKPAVTYYPELVASLEEANGAVTGYETCGKLFLAEDDTEAAQLDDVLDLFQQRRDNGMPNLGEIEDIDGSAARELFPALREIPRALYIPDAARVDGALMRDALITGARHDGAEVLTGDARLMISNGIVVLLLQSFQFHF